MTATETVCDSCGHTPRRETKHCPECGAESPWIEENLYDFDDVNLPVVFSVEHYNDTYGQWMAFCDRVFGVYELQGKQIANLPDGMPKMKYCVVDVYFKLTEDFELKGPFLEKQEVGDA